LPPPHYLIYLYRSCEIPLDPNLYNCTDRRSSIAALYLIQVCSVAYHKTFSAQVTPLCVILDISRLKPTTVLDKRSN